MVSSLRGYQALGDTLSEERNKITSGGSFVSAPFPLGRYLKLAGQKCRSLRTDLFPQGICECCANSWQRRSRQAIWDR
ncbi:hypothetical protein HNR03_003933 [Pseudomonas sp. JAI111]|nr:hypothetical protein [Pseudomonas sp. JAI111]